MSYTFAETLAWAGPFIQYSPLTAGKIFEPALSIGNMIRDSIMYIGVWPWNRKEATESVISGTQDYTFLLTDFGFLEKATLTDGQNNTFELLDVMNQAPVAAGNTVPGRPTAISVIDFNPGVSLTVRLIGIPQEAFALTLTYQKLVTEFTYDQPISVAGTATYTYPGGLFFETFQKDVASSATTVVLNNPVQVGDLLCLFNWQGPGFNLNPGVIDSLGNAYTQIHCLSDGNYSLDFFYTNSTHAGACTITVTQASGTTSFAITGGNLRGSTGIFRSITQASGNSNSISTGTFSTSVSNSIFIAACGLEGNGVPTPVAPFTEVASTPHAGAPSFLSMAVRQVTSTGTYNNQWTQTGGLQWLVANIVFDFTGGPVSTSSFNKVNYPVCSYVAISGFQNAANNGVFEVVSTTANSITVNNPNAVVESTSNGASVYSTWDPIPENYKDIYNSLFLAEAFSAVDDSRSQIYRQRGVAAMLGRADGLSAAQKNIFVQRWIADASQKSSFQSKVTQGNQGRGQ